MIVEERPKRETIKNKNNVICVKEVSDAIKSLKNNNACGSDHILNGFLKHSADRLVRVLLSYLKLFLRVV